jgi:hypothetical protein
MQYTLFWWKESGCGRTRTPMKKDYVEEYGYRKTEIPVQFIT